MERVPNVEDSSSVKYLEFLRDVERECEGYSVDFLGDRYSEWCPSAHRDDRRARERFLGIRSALLHDLAECKHAKIVELNCLLCMSRTADDASESYCRLESIVNRIAIALDFAARVACSPASEEEEPLRDPSLSDALKRADAVLYGGEVKDYTAAQLVRAYRQFVAKFHLARIHPDMCRYARALNFRARQFFCSAFPARAFGSRRFSDPFPEGEGLRVRSIAFDNEMGICGLAFFQGVYLETDADASVGEYLETVGRGAGFVDSVKTWMDGKCKHLNPDEVFKEAREGIYCALVNRDETARYDALRPFSGLRPASVVRCTRGLGPLRFANSLLAHGKDTFELEGLAKDFDDCFPGVATKHRWMAASAGALAMEKAFRAAADKPWGVNVEGRGILSFYLHHFNVASSDLASAESTDRPFVTQANGGFRVHVPSRETEGGFLTVFATAFSEAAAVWLAADCKSYSPDTAKAVTSEILLWNQLREQRGEGQERRVRAVGGNRFSLTR